MLHRSFAPQLLIELESECLNHHHYDRSATPTHLVEALLKAILLQLPNRQAILDSSPELGLSAPSSLNYGLERRWLEEFVRELNDVLAQDHPIYDPAISKHPRFLLDSMPELIPITQRGQCPKYNNVAKGIGVMNVINLDAAPGQCLAQVVKLMPGGWNDTYQVRTVELIANGPLYIFDRGYYSLETVWRLCQRQVHFIGRAKKQNLSYTVLERLEIAETQVGKVRIESDEIVMLGKEGSPHRSRVRLLKGWKPKEEKPEEEEDLWLITDQFQATAKQLLDGYQDRGKVEVYHRFEKQSAGLAHLYSFGETGMKVQVLATLLLVNLMFLSDEEEGTEGDVLKRLDRIFKRVRAKLGVHPPLRRNTVAQRRAKKPHNRRRLKRRTAVN